MRKREWIASLMLSLLMIFPVVLAQDAIEADLVGVKVGDWVKYGVSCEGDQHLWNTPLLNYFLPEDVDWVEVEVLSVSEPNVTVRETIHRFDGEERNTTSTINPGKTMYLTYRYVIPAKVTEGYKFPIDRKTYDPITKSWKTVYELSINTTASRSYNGVTREVNILKTSWLVPVLDVYIENLTVIDVWDRVTGFLLEKKWQSYWLGFENAPMSVVSMILTETNLWKIEGTTQPNWSQGLLGLLGVAVVLSAVVVASIVYKNRNKT